MTDRELPLYPHADGDNATQRRHLMANPWRNGYDQDHGIELATAKRQVEALRVCLKHLVNCEAVGCEECSEIRQTVRTYNA